MPSLAFGEPFLIPRDILSEPEQKLYDEIKEKNPEELKERYKWWSMYEIMKFYGSGLIPKVNAANFFPFKIDLTAPELLQNKYRDVDLVNGFDMAMSKLNDLSAAISDYYNQSQAKWTKETAEVTLSAATKSRGGKKMSGRPTKKSKKGGGTFIVDINKKINEIFTKETLQKQCTEALLGDVFHSRNRIFLVDNELPTYTQPTYEQLKVNAEQLIAEKAATKLVPAAIAAAAAAPAIAAVAPAAGGGGGKHKTRKHRYNPKKGKKMHTHKRPHSKKMKSRWVVKGK